MTCLLQITYDENTFFYNQLIINFIFYDEFCSTEKVSSLKRKWMLVELQGFTKEELIQKKAYLDLTHLERGGGAKMGCNSIFFSVKLKNNHKINFSGVGSTMMYCDGNVKLEENFGKLLPTITKYQVKGHFLTLKNKNGQTMKFVAEDWD